MRNLTAGVVAKDRDCEGLLDAVLLPETGALLTLFGEVSESKDTQHNK